MCFHTTYLFSLCGHLSLSEQRVKHTKPCSIAFTRPSSAVSEEREPDTPLSVHAFTSSFPSPQEFEFAKQLHDSTPASPITPVTPRNHNQDETGIVDAYGASSTAAAPSSDSNADNHTSLLSSSCPSPIRHPLHTYILPLLCAPCQQARLQNIAHFEAQTIRETVEREQAFGYNKNGVVDPERKKIARKKGELIPLICVEEARIQKENIPTPDPGDVQEAVTAMCETVEQDEESKKLVEEMEQMNAQIEATGVGSAVAANAEKGASTNVRRQDPHSHRLFTASTNTTTAVSSGWSWWGRGTASAPASTSTSPAPPKAATLAPAPPQQEHAHKKTVSRISVGGPRPTSPRVNVSRDVFGRNLQGMNRIMRWDGNGAQAA